MRKQICVTGLGTVGLPLAVVLATSGYAVLGVDTNDQVVSRVEAGELAFPEPNLQDLLRRAIKSGFFKASTDPTSADIQILAVPTLLDLNKQADLSRVYEAVSVIKPYLRSGDLVLIESTCPIGTTETIASELKESCPGVHVAYCPERVLPGQILHELIHNDRVVGGIDKVSTEHATAFYRSFVQGEVWTTNARTAEAVKLVENGYRDINIAYANELSMVADRKGLDVNEVIRLANRHPRVQILKPGVGVGGYCVGVSPWLFASSAPDLAALTSTAREVNTEKTRWVIQKIRDVIREKGAHTIVCLGLTYKADVADTRESPALAIVKALEKETKVLRVDPHVPHTDPLDEALERAEIVIALVAHSSFRDIPLRRLEGKAVLDFAGVFSK